MYISVDVEADGPCPGLYSMVRLGAVVANRSLKSFGCNLKPLPFALYQDAALRASGLSREDTMKYPLPDAGMYDFDKWLESIKPSNEPLIFISDNNGFDWQFVNYYFWKFLGRNPFGFSSRRIGDIYSGMQNDMRSTRWKHLRDTEHTHNPVDDAMGNSEALMKIIDMMYRKKSYSSTKVS